MKEYRIEYRDRRFAGTILTGVHGEDEIEAQKRFADVLDFFEEKNIEVVGVKLMPPT